MNCLYPFKGYIIRIGLEVLICHHCMLHSNSVTSIHCPLDHLWCNDYFLRLLGTSLVLYRFEGCIGSSQYVLLHTPMKLLSTLGKMMNPNKSLFTSFIFLYIAGEIWPPKIVCYLLRNLLFHNVSDKKVTLGHCYLVTLLLMFTEFG